MDPLHKRLFSLQTEYDVEGRLNRNLIRHTEEQIHNKSIDYSHYARNKTDTVLGLKPVNHQFVSSEALKQNIKLKELQAILKKYNEDAQTANGKALPGMHFRGVVIESVLKLVRMMNLSPDIATKVRILNSAHDFAMRKLSPKQYSKLERQWTQKGQKKQLAAIAEAKEEEKNILEAIIKPGIDKMLPSDKAAEERYHYEIQARTQFPKLDPPGQELESYQTHRVGLNYGRHLSTRPNITDRLSRIVYKKPDFDDLLRTPWHMDPVKPNQPQPVEIKQPIQPVISVEPVVAGNVVTGDASTIPPVAQGGLIQEEQVAGDTFGQIDEAGEPEEPEVQENDMNERAGKLDPLVKAFIRKRLKEQEKPKALLTVQHKLKAVLTKGQRGIHEDDGAASMLAEWANLKNRQKTELARKIQAKKAFRNINRSKALSVMEKSTSEANTKGVEVFTLASHQETSEQTMERDKVLLQMKEAAKEFAHVMGREVNRQTVNSQRGLSLFDRRRVKTESRDFSEIVLKNNNRDVLMNQTLDQIELIQRKLASNRVRVQLSSLQSALIQMPRQQSKSEYLPLPDSQLPSNPFMKVAKKKKKKSKK